MKLFLLFYSDVTEEYHISVNYLHKSYIECDIVSCEGFKMCAMVCSLYCGDVVLVHVLFPLFALFSLMFFRKMTMKPQQKLHKTTNTFPTNNNLNVTFFWGKLFQKKKM